MKFRFFRKNKKIAVFGLIPPIVEGNKTKNCGNNLRQPQIYFNYRIETALGAVSRVVRITKLR